MSLDDRDGVAALNAHTVGDSINPFWFQVPALPKLGGRWYTVGGTINPI
jgi:hypothetical protein